MLPYSDKLNLMSVQEEQEEHEGGSSDSPDEEEEVKSLLETESISSTDSQETKKVREFVLPLMGCKSITDQVERISFVLSMWEASATINKRRQILIENTNIC